MAEAMNEGTLLGAYVDKGKFDRAAFTASDGIALAAGAAAYACARRFQWVFAQASACNIPVIMLLQQQVSYQSP
jgi:hypothetical protein